MSGKNGDISSFLRGLNLADARVRRGAARGLNGAMATILKRAARYAPVDTGNLKDSNVQEPAEVTAARIEVAGGFTVDYAAAVHENTEAKFNKEKNPEARPKYLEAGLRETLPQAPAYVGAKIDAELQGGSR